jgi:hypothetical protein
MAAFHPEPTPGKGTKRPDFTHYRIKNSKLRVVRIIAAKMMPERGPR